MGNVDTNFDPNSNSNVFAITQQLDGKILVGGEFTTLNGMARNRIARLSADEAALQQITVSSDGNTLTWMRSQSSPEIDQVTFDYSADGAVWIPLSSATRIGGGWELTGQSLSPNEIDYIRAQGQTSGGIYNGSTGMIESIRQYYNFSPTTPTPTATPILTMTPTVTTTPTQTTPELNALLSNLIIYPNPFRTPSQHVTIQYMLSEDADVTITLYTYLGAKVKTITRQAGEPGGQGHAQGQVNQVTWDGRNSRGLLQATGGYICQVVAKSRESENKEVAKIKIGLIR